MTQIETLMRQMEAKINSLQESIAAKDTEIAELKAEWGKTRNYLVERVDKAEVANAKLKAEIKRLREAAQRARQYCECGNGRGGATKLPSGEWFDEGEGTLYHVVLSVLSPAPVTLSVLPDKCTCVYNFPGDLVKQCQSCKESRLLSPAPVTEDKFSVSAYPKECVPTIEQLTENDGMSMMERLEKRMPPFHKIDSPKNEDQA